MIPIAHVQTCRYPKHGSLHINLHSFGFLFEERLQHRQELCTGHPDKKIGRLQKSSKMVSSFHENYSIYLKEDPIVTFPSHPQILQQADESGVVNKEIRQVFMDEIGRKNEKKF